MIECSPSYIPEPEDSGEIPIDIDDRCIATVGGSYIEYDLPWMSRRPGIDRCEKSSNTKKIPHSFRIQDQETGKDNYKKCEEKFTNHDTHVYTTARMVENTDISAMVLKNSRKSQRNILIIIYIHT